MKKTVMLLLAMLMATAGYAQFEKGKYYVGASFSGFNLSYSGAEKLNLGLDAQAGRMIADDWMLFGRLGYSHSGLDGASDTFSVGIGGRYYIIQNGLYLGVNARLVHANHNYNDLMPGIEVGYAFFVSRTVTIEPAVYYDQSFNNHSDYSKLGFRIGVGVYL